VTGDRVAESAASRGATVAVLGLIGLAMVYRIDDLDVWWLLRSGAYMVETRSFPTTDPFSWSASGAEWVNHAWGFQLLLYAAWRLGGTTGLIALQAVFAVLTFAVLFRLLRAEGLPAGWARLAVAVGALATWGFWSPRPQVLTYLLLVTFWAILRRYRDGQGDRLVWLPILTMVWANFHGAYMVGLALIGLCLAGLLVDRTLRPEAGEPGGGPSPGRLALAGAACCLATFATPFHYKAVLFPFQVLTDRFARATIIEWASPGFQYGQIRLVEGLVLATLVLLVVSPRRLRALDAIVLAAFFHFSLQAVRNVPLLVVVLLPILARAAHEVALERGPAWIARSGLPPRRAMVGFTIVALVAAGWWTVPARPNWYFVPRLGVSDIFPAGAVEYLRQHRPPGPLFNDYGWGGYLVWRLYPDYRVGIDGRAAVYGPRRFAEYAEIADLRPRWRETLDGSQARLALIKAGSPLAIALRAAPDWQVLYEDRLAVVLARRGSS
jgi:hypothetical protein